jgi:hypothetical protein
MARVAPPDEMKRYLEAVGVFAAMSGRPVVRGAAVRPIVAAPVAAPVPVPAPAPVVRAAPVPGHVAPRAVPPPVLAGGGGVPWWVWVPVAAAALFLVAAVVS